MKLSSSTDYALRIVLWVGMNTGINSAKEVVENCQIPKSLGLRIITSLVHNKILKSIAGKNGGIFLERSPSSISAYDIITAIETLAIKECIDNPELCKWKKGNCSICMKIAEAKEEFIRNLKNITLEQLIELEKLN